jgi:hypothetical protein
MEQSLAHAQDAVSLQAATGPDDSPEDAPRPTPGRPVMREIELETAPGAEADY